MYTPGFGVKLGFGTGAIDSVRFGQFAIALSSFAIISFVLKSPETAKMKFDG